MFDAVTAMVFGLAGLMLGGALVWLAMRGRGAGTDSGAVAAAEARLDERARALADSEAKGAALENAAREMQATVTELTAALRARETEADGLRKLETELLETRAAAQTRGEKIAALDAEIETQRRAFAQQQAILGEAQTKLQDAFKALASDALNRNNQAFLELAKANLAQEREAAKSEAAQGKQAVGEIVAPLAKQLERYEKQIADMELMRQKSYGELLQQVVSLDRTQKDLSKETRNLVDALRKPQTRGRWGEITLKRVAELAGMVDHCDFETQSSVESEGGLLRPDMTINLPGGRRIVVDSKTPLAAYLEAFEAPDEAARELALDRHARHVGDHMKKLSEKQYWAQFKDATPDFVLMFIPAENFLNAALDRIPALIESGFQQKVILASPSTLIVMLKAVALSWRQEQVAANAREISELGTHLYERLATMAEHLVKLGGSLGNSVEHYNKAVGTLETRVLVTARKFPELGIAPKKDLPELAPVESAPRRLDSPEMIEINTPAKIVDATENHRG